MFAINYEVSYSGNIEDTEDSDNELHIEDEESAKGTITSYRKLSFKMS